MPSSWTSWVSAEAPRFQITVTASPADIDELGHVNNAVYLRWIQDVATAHWRSVAPADVQAAWVWVVTRHEIDHLRQTLAGETLTLSTWVGAHRGARFDRHVEIHGPDGTLRVRAVTAWALIDRASGRLSRVRDDLISLFAPGG